MSTEYLTTDVSQADVLGVKDDVELSFCYFSAHYPAIFVGFDAVFFDLIRASGTVGEKKKQTA